MLIDFLELVFLNFLAKWKVTALEGHVLQYFYLSGAFNKRQKYSALANYFFVPMAVEVTIRYDSEDDF